MTTNFKLAKSKVIAQKLIFDDRKGINKAINDGFFLVKIPSEIDLSPGLKLKKFL